MVGIESFGAYVPLHRLTFEEIGRAWGNGAAKGERSVAAEDEDSLTMSVEAALDCLNGADRELVDSVIFASTTSPFFEKQAAVTIATAADLRTDISTLDCTGSLRAGTGALMAAMNSVAAGMCRKALVTIADCRIGEPGSSFESALGDGGAAFVVGDSDPAIRIVGRYSVADEMTDYWRRTEDQFVRSWEERFALSEGFLRVVPKAVTTALATHNRQLKDVTSFVSNAPNERAYWDVAKKLKLDLATQVAPPYYSNVGHTGAAFGAMQLVARLESAKPGDFIVFANYGNGCDVLLLEVRSDTALARGRRAIAGHLASKKHLRNYNQYALFRGILPAKSDRMPPIRPPATVLWRDQKSLLRFHAMKCGRCGHVQYPIHRICSNCRMTDCYEPVRLSNQTATVFACTVDSLGYGAGQAPFWAIADFPSVRVRLQIADADLQEVNVGDPLEMTFRKLPSENDMPVYGWKARRVR